MFTYEHLKVNEKSSTDCGFYLLCKGGTAKSEGLI